MPSQWLAVEAGTDLLARARQIQRSWESLLAGGALNQELPPQATAELRPAIVESWRRSLATGLDPTDLLPAIEADPSETRERWLEHPLGSLRHVLAQQLQTLAQESNSLVQVTDPSGLTLHLDGPESLKARAAEMNLVEGARCAETVNGTNGVGTALAANHPVQVFAFEHFSHHHREWVCSGSPIRDPVSGRLVGVLDLSSPWRIAHPRSLKLVTRAATMLEQCLLETRRDQDARLRRRYGDLATTSTDLLVNREGYVLVGDSVHPKPFDVPESGGEITMGDGSLAVAEPLGRGEAYLLRRLAPPRARAARVEALERAEGRVHEQAREHAARRYRRDQGLAVTMDSGRTSIESDQRVSAYFEAALDCVIMADASGRVVEFNPAAERTFGYSRDEALGRTIAELIVPPSLRARHSVALARFIETGRGTMLGRRLELTAMRADGSEFPVELALSQVEAEPVLICGALRDISAAKKAETHLRELADEQAALRRVAMLVAGEAAPQLLFEVVSEEVARIVNVPLVRLLRYEPDGAVVELIGGWGESVDPIAVGRRWRLDGPGVLATVWQTGRSARRDDYTNTPGEAAAVIQQAGMRSAVASPIIVEGRLWGAISVLSPRLEPLPEDTEARLADFTELVATAIANAESRGELAASEGRARKLAAELAASRARVIAAGDETRRRIERDLHDGAQQQLVTLALGLRSAQGRVPAGLEDLRTKVGRFADQLTSVFEELREMSRGIHPAILTEGGLSPALKALALRSPVRVKLNVRCERRLPDGIEVAAYYVVSEALTNAAKHADASRVQIDLHVKEETLYLSIVDDGVGGADSSGGSGLIGLKDRVEALGGTLDVASPPGSGTRLDVEIPLLQDPPVASNSEPLSRV